MTIHPLPVADRAPRIEGSAAYKALTLNYDQLRRLLAVVAGPCGSQAASGFSLVPIQCPLITELQVSIESEN
jgi:hypothetical protein